MVSEPLCGSYYVTVWVLYLSLVAVSGELFPGPCDPMDYVPQFEATGVGK